MALFTTPHFEIFYETWGDPRDRATLFFHGFPGSHIQASVLAPVVGKHKIFLIACDRPGYGGTRGSGTALDYLDSLKLLLTHLHADRLNLLGVSGGSPWAHMMASRCADRVNRLAIICGLGTYNRETQDYFSDFQHRGLRLKRILPNLAAELMVGAALRGFKPERGMEPFLRMLTKPDQDVLRDPKNRELLMASMKQARAQGGKGIVRDASLYHQDWLTQYCIPASAIPTFYFHGKQDRILDYRMSEWMSGRNPNARLTLLESEGHYSLPLNQADLVLSSIASD